MEILFWLLIILVASRFAGELMQRAGQPALLGELLAGVGLSLLALFFPGQFQAVAQLPEREAFKIVADLGIFFLMFLAGLEMEPNELIRASGTGFAVAIGGVVLPMALGIWIGYAFMPESSFRFAQIIFLGVALSITAVAVSTKVLLDMKLLESRFGRVIISAAVIDDVLALILLAALISLAESGEMPSLATVSVMLLRAGVFFGGALLLGRYVFHRLEAALNQLVSDEIAFTVTVAIALSFGIVSEIMGMHFIIGAFVAGLFIHVGTVGVDLFDRIRDRTAGITLGFLAPIFFVSIGLQLDLSSLVSAPTFTILLTLAAIVGKLGGCGLVARWSGFTNRESLAVGTAMNGRGAVELILAAIALEFGLFTQPQPVPPVVASMYSGIVTMAFVTTLLTPLGLKWLLKGEGQ